jgi:large conductance mechanosensitive channel
MKSFLEEFKKFALRGNVLDLAVGVVIGTAFTAITSSLVANIITPPLGLLLGRIDFKDWSLNLGGNVNIQYGLFIQSVMDFIIIALVLFFVVRLINRLERVARKEQAEGTAPPAEKSAELVVLEDIRDSLKAAPAPKQ